MKHGKGIYIVLVHFLLQIQASDARYCPEAVDSAEYVISCPSSKSEWDTAAQKKNCSKIALHQDCSTVEKFQYHCVINGYRNKMVEVCAPSRIIFGHCVEFNLLGGVIQDQMSFPCSDRFPKCDVVYKSTAAYKYPDCYDLISKFPTKADTTTKIYVLTTTPTTDKSSFLDLIAVIVSAVTCFVTISLLVIAIVRVLCKNKRRSTKRDRKPLTSTTNEDQSFDTQEWNKKEAEKIYSRDDAFELNQEDENIDDDDNNNNDINTIQTDQSSLGNLQHAKEALSDRELQENMFQESIMSEINIYV